MSAPPSAAERRRSAGAAVVAAHPRWHGIRHPELVALPSRRFSQLDMRPAIERRRARYASTRAERSAAIVAAHPRWHGIKHPDHLDFGRSTELETAVLAYRAALRIALAHLRDSEQLCREIEAVADRIDRRGWPWGAMPSRLRAGPPPRRQRRLPRLPKLPTLRLPRRHARPVGRLLPH